MSEESSKFWWKVLDRVVFIGIGVVGTIATTYITTNMKDSSPELKVESVFNYVDKSEVQKQIGDLKINYIADTRVDFGVLRIDIKNTGKGPAENLRFQVKFPDKLSTEYHITPDFKVYKPDVFEFRRNELYVEMPLFPSNAHEWIALRVQGDYSLLCDMRIKLVSDNYEGEVLPVKGMVQCQ